SRLFRDAVAGFVFRFLFTCLITMSGARGTNEKAMPCNLGSAQLAAGRGRGAGHVGGAGPGRRLLPAAGRVLRVLLPQADPGILSRVGPAGPAAPKRILAVPDPAAAGLAAAEQRLSDMA